MARYENYAITSQPETTASIQAVVSALTSSQAVVSALTSSQEGITGTAVSSQGSQEGNPILPGVGAITLAAVGRTIVVADNTVSPNLGGANLQGTMTLANGQQSASVSVSTSGTRTMVRSTGGADERPAVSSPALPIFNATKSQASPTESAAFVTDQGSSVSAVDASANGTGLTAQAAIDAGARDAQRGTGVEAEVRWPDGNTSTLLVSFTTEGVLVIRIPQGAVDTGAEKAITLLALASAKERLGVRADALRGVLITRGQR